MEWYWWVASYVAIMVAGCFLCGWLRLYGGVGLMLVWPVGIPVLVALWAAERAEEMSREFRYWLDRRAEARKQ